MQDKQGSYITHCQAASSSNATVTLDKNNNEEN